MSLATVRQYFIARAKAVGLQEFPNNFSSPNAPNTVIHKSFEVELGDFTGRGPVNQRTQDIDCPVSVIFYMKGFNRVDLAKDAGTELGEKLFRESMLAKNRLGACIKNVILNSLRVEPFSESNDTIVRVTVSMTARFFIVIDQ